MEETQKGTVIKWMADKGFGFIKADGSTPEAKGIFVHHSEVNRHPGQRRVDLVIGDRVDFIIKMSDRGPQATDVSVI